MKINKTLHESSKIDSSSPSQPMIQPTRNFSFHLPKTSFASIMGNPSSDLMIITLLTITCFVFILIIFVFRLLLTKNKILKSKGDERIGEASSDTFEDGNYFHEKNDEKINKEYEKNSGKTKNNLILNIYGIENLVTNSKTFGKENKHDSTEFLMQNKINEKEISIQKKDFIPSQNIFFKSDSECSILNTIHDTSNQTNKHKNNQKSKHTNNEAHIQANKTHQTIIPQHQTKKTSQHTSKTSPHHTHTTKAPQHHMDITPQHHANITSHPHTNQHYLPSVSFSNQPNVLVNKKDINDNLPSSAQNQLPLFESSSSIGAAPKETHATKKEVGAIIQPMQVGSSMQVCKQQLNEINVKKNDRNTQLSSQNAVDKSEFMGFDASSIICLSVGRHNGYAISPTDDKLSEYYGNTQQCP